MVLVVVDDMAIGSPAGRAPNGAPEARGPNHDSQEALTSSVHDQIDHHLNRLNPMLFFFANSVFFDSVHGRILGQ